MMNTKINYLYRDASNYKVYNEAVINGILSVEDIETILECRFDGNWFIPRRVGLPEKRFEEWTEDDTDYFELDEDSFEIVEEEPTVDITPEKLVKLFERQLWY